MNVSFTISLRTTLEKTYPSCVSGQVGKKKKAPRISPFKKIGEQTILSEEKHSICPWQTNWSLNATQFSSRVSVNSSKNNSDLSPPKSTKKNSPPYLASKKRWLEANWLVVSTHFYQICLSNWIMSPRIGVKIKNVWKHHPANHQPTEEKGGATTNFPRHDRGTESDILPALDMPWD